MGLSLVYYLVRPRGTKIPRMNQVLEVARKRVDDPTVISDDRPDLDRRLGSTVAGWTWMRIELGPSRGTP